jgi:hypothetical protein
MNVLKAMQDTTRIAFERCMKGEGSLSYEHIAGMQITMQESEMSYGKMCRWLGWAQCAVVASGVATLDDMKAINTLNKA